jgi:hypothetical protein
MSKKRRRCDVAGAAGASTAEAAAAAEVDVVPWCVRVKRLFPLLDWKVNGMSTCLHPRQGCLAALARPAASEDFVCSQQEVECLMYRMVFWGLLGKRAKSLSLSEIDAAKMQEYNHHTWTDWKTLDDAMQRLEQSTTTIQMSCGSAANWNKKALKRAVVETEVISTICKTATQTKPFGWYVAALRCSLFGRHRPIAATIPSVFEAKHNLYKLYHEIKPQWLKTWFVVQFVRLLAMCKSKSPLQAIREEVGRHMDKLLTIEKIERQFPGHRHTKGTCVSGACATDDVALDLRFATVALVLCPTRHGTLNACELPASNVFVTTNKIEIRALCDIKLGIWHLWRLPDGNDEVKFLGDRFHILPGCSRRLILQTSLSPADNVETWLKWDEASVVYKAALFPYPHELSLHFRNFVVEYWYLRPIVAQMLAELFGVSLSSFVSIILQYCSRTKRQPDDLYSEFAVDDYDDAPDGYGISQSKNP